MEEFSNLYHNLLDFWTKNYGVEESKSNFILKAWLKKTTYI